MSHSAVQGGEEDVYLGALSYLAWLDGNIDADPMFVGGGDYHLTADSPCIDMGADGGVYTDIDGEFRPQGAGYDMGADEYLDPDCWDVDMDGYGDQICGGSDCDDSDPDVNPGAEELCNGIDDNCDGFIDNIDKDEDGYIDSACGGRDCDDTDPLTYPGAPEICDGNDNDCDSILPEDEEDADGDGWIICEGDCDDFAPEVNPGAEEICDNGIDED